MTVNELRKALEDFDGDLEVRLAFQPSWPFEYSIGRVTEADVNAADPADGDPEEGVETEEENVVYIGEGSQLGYLPYGACNELDWKERR